MPEAGNPTDDSGDVVDLAAFRAKRKQKTIFNQSADWRAGLDRLAPTPKDDETLENVHAYAADGEGAAPLTEREKALIEYMNSVDSSLWTEVAFEEFMASRNETMHETEDQ